MWLDIGNPILHQSGHKFILVDSIPFWSAQVLAQAMLGLRG